MGSAWLDGAAFPSLTPDDTPEQGTPRSLLQEATERPSDRVGGLALAPAACLRLSQLPAGVPSAPALQTCTSLTKRRGPHTECARLFAGFTEVPVSDEHAFPRQHTSFVGKRNRPGHLPAVTKPHPRPLDSHTNLPGPLARPWCQREGGCREGRTGPPPTVNLMPSSVRSLRCPTRTQAQGQPL